MSRITRISPFTTKSPNPRVIKIMGEKTSFKIGRRIRFKMVKTRVTEAKVERSVDKLKPVRYFAESHSAAPFMRKATTILERSRML